MLWLNPAALVALVAVAAPILIHILIQRRAERFPFPTLRFLQPTPLAAIRRHLLEDVSLLAVRVGLLAAAVAALAGPLLVTASRRQAWDRRVVRAIVTDDRVRADDVARVAVPAIAYQQRTFQGGSLADQVRLAILWLEAAPPARREIVIASPLTIGSITSADISGVPAAIGIQFERLGTLPAMQTVAGGRLLTGDRSIERQLTLAGDRTSVHESATDRGTWPIDVVSSADDQPAIDAAIAAVLSQRVWTAPEDRRVQLVVMDAATGARPTARGVAPAADLKVRTTFGAGVVPADGASGVVPALRPAVAAAMAGASAIARPWMALAVARIAVDEALQVTSRRVASGLPDARFNAAPWQTLASAADGRPLAAAAASGDRLLVASGAPAQDFLTPLLLRSIANAIAILPDVRRAEVLPIADAVLRAWSRPAGPSSPPRIDTVDRDDRRWVWALVLLLLALEHWIRRARSVTTSSDRHEEAARVA